MKKKLIEEVKKDDHPPFKIPLYLLSLLMLGIEIRF